MGIPYGEMEFTGERYVPAIGGSIRYEHLHRYSACRSLVHGRDVLDLGSGEGYGAALLAASARKVIGVDIDAPAVEHSRVTYCDRHRNLRFEVGRGDAVPLPAGSIDVVVSFEMLEHHNMHNQMMLEIKRVLRPHGVLILSSPNRATYSARAGGPNPHHVRELDGDEFHELVRNHFTHVEIFGQEIATASVIYPLNGRRGDYAGHAGAPPASVREGSLLEAPIFFLAVCSESKLELEQARLASFYVESGGTSPDDWQWDRRRQAAVDELTELIPADASYVLVDQDQLRDVLPEAGAIPFIERDGMYWGPPNDSATAIQELDRLRVLGPAFLVFAWPAFWWLEHYSELSDYLSRNYPRMAESANLIVFDLR